MQKFSTSFIDAYIEPTHTLIEQKSIDKDLSELLPHQWAKLGTNRILIATNCPYRFEMYRLWVVVFRKKTMYASIPPMRLSRP